MIDQDLKTMHHFTPLVLDKDLDQITGVGLGDWETSVDCNEILCIHFLCWWCSAWECTCNPQNAPIESRVCILI